MSEKNRPTGGDLPLARPLNEPQLARPVVRAREETGRGEEEQRQAPRTVEQEGAPRAEEERPEAARVEGEQEERGLLDKAVDEARERGLVSEQTAEEIREKGKSLIERAKDKLSGR